MVLVYQLTNKIIILTPVTRRTCPTNVLSGKPILVQNRFNIPLFDGEERTSDSSNQIFYLLGVKTTDHQLSMFISKLAFTIPILL